MWFKKNKLNKSSPLIINIIWVISLLVIFFLWLILIKNIPFFNFNNNIQTSTWTLLNKWKESKVLLNNSENTWALLNSNSNININDNHKIKESDKIKEFINKKNDKDKINILVVWIWWWDHDAPNLTDTIILTSINTKTKSISMLSIPRDLYVEYPSNKDKDKNENDNAWKINWLYAKYKFENNSKKIWMNILKRKITEVTGEKIDYFINIDFKWFIKIIDTIWWIEINIPKTFIDERYPDWNWWYKKLIFKKWTWLFDWENALKYARSRHSTSDFDRSNRQQKVIKSIKDKLTWSYFFTSPSKLKELYDVFNKYVYTDIKLSTLIKLSYILNLSDNFNILSSNINDSCFYWSDICQKWWFLYTPKRSYFWWMSVLLPEWSDIVNLNKYNNLHIYTNIVFNHPKFFSENYKLNIFNSLKVNHLAWKLSNDIVRYGFNIPKNNSIWNTKKVYSKSIIYYNNIDINSDTMKILKTFTNTQLIKTDFPKYSNDNANIEIIIWEDYLSDKNPFKF